MVAFIIIGAVFLLAGVLLSIKRYRDAEKKKIFPLISDLAMLILLGVLFTLSALEYYGVYTFEYTLILYTVFIMVDIIRLVMSQSKKKK